MPKKNKDDYAELREKIKKQGNCETCWGYGLWAIGQPVPMGQIDFADGMPANLCLECNSGARNTWKVADGLVLPIEQLTDGHLKNIVLHLDERKEEDTPVRRMMEGEVKRRKK